MAIFITALFYATLISLLSYVAFRYSRRRLYKLSEVLPGRPTLPLIGNAHQFAGSTKDIMSNIDSIVRFTEENGGISKTWLGPKLYIAVTDPAAAEIVLNTEMNKAGVYQFMHSWIGNGLVSGKVPVWKRHRKMISPAFGQKVLDGFVSIFGEQSDILVQKLSKEVDNGPFDVFEYVSPCTLDIVCESAMGVKMNAQDNQNASYIKAGVEQMQIVYQRMFQIWLQPQWLFNMTKYRKIEDKNLEILLDFTETIVRRKMGKSGEKQTKDDTVEYVENSRYKAFLDTMLEFINASAPKDRWTEVELREEVDTMTIAGNDTTAHASSFVLKILACLPHIQDRVVDELREIFGDSERPVEKEDLPRMVYLERVIKETLRLYPLVPIVVRELTQDVPLGEGKPTLPAGADSVIGIIGLHRDKRVWGENSDEFDPDRFLPENCKGRHPYQYIPFSAGPRNCIGRQYAMMSVKCLVSTVLRAYRLSSDADYRKISLKAEILIKPIEGHMLSISRRERL